MWQPEERHLMHVISSNIASALDRKAYIEQYKNSELRLRMALAGAKRVCVGLESYNR